MSSVLHFGWTVAFVLNHTSRRATKVLVGKMGFIYTVLKLVSRVSYALVMC
jgi:hypothetical protein